MFYVYTAMQCSDVTHRQRLRSVCRHGLAANAAADRTAPQTPHIRLLDIYTRRRLGGFKPPLGQFFRTKIIAKYKTKHVSYVSLLYRFLFGE